jgi:hypothetical protein
MQIVEVNNTHTAQEFLQINRTLNRHNPCYISPLDNEVSEVFDPKKITYSSSENVIVGF